MGRGAPATSSSPRALPGPSIEGGAMPDTQDDFQKNLADWLDRGFAAGFCGPAVCATHDGVPMTAAEEEALWEHDDDICVPVIRVYSCPAEGKAVHANHAPTQWRAAL